MLTYHDIAINYDLFCEYLFESYIILHINYDLFCEYLFESYIILLYLYIIKVFYGFSFTLTSDGLYIHLEKVFVLIPVLSVYNSYSNIYYWQNIGLLFITLDLISKILSQIL